MKKWVCTVCGYVYEGENPPAECPQCHVPAEKFQEMAGERTWAAEHVVGVAERGYDVHPEGVEQLEIAHEQIARDQPSADEHRDDEEDHDAALARHFPLGHDVPARNHEHQHGRHAQYGARHGNAHGVPEIELVKHVFIRLQRGLLGNDDEIILLDHFALRCKRHANHV